MVFNLHEVLFLQEVLMEEPHDGVENNISLVTKYNSLSVRNHMVRPEP